MSDSAPPPRYVAYPRQTTQPYGTVERLEALGEGYFALSRAFAVSILSSLVFLVVAGSVGSETTEARLIQALLLLAYSALVGFLVLTPNRKVCAGRNWPTGYAVVASVLTGLSALFCFGVLGFMFMQQFALFEMKKYGIKPGLRFNQKTFRKLVEQRRDLEKNAANELTSLANSSEE